MSRRDDYRLEGATCIKATARALLIESDELDESTWIPLSQVSDDSEVLDEGDEGVMIITAWLAEQKGWR